MAAKLIAPAIESSFSSGFDWVVETVKSSPSAEIASELEIAKAVQFLKVKDFSKVVHQYCINSTLPYSQLTKNWTWMKAIETLKAFEKKDAKLVGTAAT